ncbi:MAG: response regulator [Magnetococcales bacterium]|nr:response regulator [Magnetococcales bacterium]
MAKEKILVVDDERLIFDSIEDALDDHYELHYAGNGQTALELHATLNPILIMLDMRMPIMDGFEFLHRLGVSNDKPYAVIVLSGHTTGADIGKCYEMGITAFLRKPFNIFELKGLVKHSIDAKKLQLSHARLLTDARDRENAETMDLLFSLVGDYTSIKDRENAETLDLLFSLVGDLLCIIDNEGRLLRVSHFWKTILGYAPDQIQGHNFMDALHPEDVAPFRAALNSLLEQSNPPIFHIINRYQHKDGSWHWVEWSVATHKKKAFYATGRDITEQKNREEQLMQARDLADQANRAKGAFLAIVSHEIRTPMNAIIGLNTLALQHNLPIKVRDYLRKMRTASHALLRILNDILDLSKMEAGKLEIEQIPFYLVETFENIGNLFRHKGGDKNIELVLVLPNNLLFEMIGDPLRLGQILVNLVSNAIKFTHAGEVVVQAECLQQTADQVFVQFSVRDTGIGISPEQQQALFHAFAQADSSTTRRYGGSGLGLAISKQLVERMGGEIWIESAIGAGSTFHFTAWLGIGPEHSQHPLLLEEDLRGLKVLVVDDNETSQEVLSALLHSFDLKVTTANSGKEALTALETAHAMEEPFALILIDYRMPEMDGLTTATIIQQQKHLFSTLPNLLPATTIPKIVLMSAFASDDVQKNAEKFGLDGFIEKPCSRLFLFDSIRELFGKEVATQFQQQNLTDVEQQVRELLSGARILLVDDIDLNRQVARELLEGMGLLIELASDGQEAVEKVQQTGTSFDAILMDLEMPGMDGYQATRLIRQSSRHAKLPIIAVTAHAMDGIWERCLAAGMNDHIAKPIDNVALCHLLLRWIPARIPSKEIIQAVAAQTKRLQQEASQTENDPLPASMPGVNLPAARQRMNNNAKLLREMYLSFLRDFSHVGEKIRADLEKGEEENRKAARMCAHTIKGMAGNLSAEQLYLAARDLEDEIHKGQKERWPARLELFEQAIQQVMASIQVHIAGRTLGAEADSPPRGAPMEAETIRLHVQKLYRLICANHSDAEDVFASLKAGWPVDLLPEEMAQLESCLSQYDFEAALHPLQAIARHQGMTLEAMGGS